MEKNARELSGSDDYFIKLSGFTDIFGQVFAINLKSL